MKVVGIDFSTHAVDLCALDVDTGYATWTHVSLEGNDAFERTRAVRPRMQEILPLAFPGGSYWDDVVACAIEEPAGRLTGRLFRIQGAILACLPRDLLLEKLMPSQWRKAVGLKGNATKEDVKDRAWESLAVMHSSQGWLSPDMPQDVWDAYCLALAVSTLWEKADMRGIVQAGC